MAGELRISQGRFLFNGNPSFLLSCSYFAALGANEKNIRGDLDDLQKPGFNCIRVWATWRSSGVDISAVDEQGNARQPYMQRLVELVRECDRRGMVVDLTLTRGKPGIQGQAAHQRAIESIDRQLRGMGNWYIDLANERDIRDARFVGIEEIAQLRAWLAKADPRRLVTASHGGDIGPRELEQDLLEAKLSFISVHRPRDAKSPAQTAEKTRQWLGWMKEHHALVPIVYDEPFRRGYGKWEPRAGDFLADLKAAREGGAAGWCFHNGSERNSPSHLPGRSFDLREKRLMDQLDSEEKAFLASLNEKPR